ncbi:MAG: lipopolysaccharide assembly protein LapA domain-containing protein [Thermoleophilia bacterium]
MADTKPVGTTTTTERRALTPKHIALIVVGVLALIFIFQNTSRRTVSFLWIDMRAPMFLWLLITFVAGAIVGWLLLHLRKRDGKD